MTQNLRRGWLRIFRRGREDEERRREMEDYLARETEENIAQGMGPEEARRVAHVKLGNTRRIREEIYKMNGIGFLETLWQDVKYAARMLRKSPGFTAVAVLTLALGIGVNATVFSWIRTIVLDPLPGTPDSSRLVVVVPAYRGNIHSSALSYPEFQELAGLGTVFSGVAGTHYTSALMTVNGASQWVYGRVASANILEVLGIKAELGRGFLPEEDRGEGGHPVLVISHALWREQFGGERSIVGRTVRLNQQLFTIVGVAPPQVQGTGDGLRTDFWAPLTMHNEVLQYGSFSSRTFRWISALARLGPGVSKNQAQAAVGLLAAQLAKSYPDSNKDFVMRVFSLPESPVGGQAEFLPVLRILLAVSIGVLFIVIVNVANLLLARATGREREFAIRLSLGAGRGRLMRQMLTEGLLLSALGGALGVLLSQWSVPLFSSLAAIAYYPYGFTYTFHLNWSTVAFTAALVGLTAVVFGMVPAIQWGHANLHAVLKESAHGSCEGVRQVKIRSALIVMEMALALILLVSARLCVQGFWKAGRIDVGFDPKNVLTADLSLVPSRYTAERGKVFDRQLRERLAALPGVSSAALASTLPLGTGTIFTATVDVEGYGAAQSEDRQVSFIIVSPGYFDVMRIPVLEGRDFRDQDDASTGNVVVINQTMAKRFWPSLDPLGRKFLMAAGIAPSDSFTVIGVVGSGKYRSLAESPTPLLYMTYEQRPIASLFMGVAMRTKGSPEQMIPLLRREIHALDPAVEPLDILSMETYIQPAFNSARLAAQFLVILAGAALFLASLGLYGVMAFFVSRRSHEIGIRMALGAQRADVLRMILKEGAKLAILGIGAGTLVAAAFTRLLSSFLYGVSATDPATFMSVAIMLVLVSLAACYVPARRAMRVDPMVALRYE